MAILRKNPPNILYHILKILHLKIDQVLLLEINLVPWNKIYKKELFTSDVRFPENLKYEDAIVVVKTMLKAKKLEC